MQILKITNSLAYNNYARAENSTRKLNVYFNNAPSEAKLIPALQHA